MLGTVKQLSSKFSVTMQVRDKKGRLTGKTKDFHTDSAEDLANFVERYTPQPRKNKIEKLPSGQEADKIMTKIATYAEKKQQNKEVVKS